MVDHFLEMLLQLSFHLFYLVKPISTANPLCFLCCRRSMCLCPGHHRATEIFSRETVFVCKVSHFCRPSRNLVIDSLVFGHQASCEESRFLWECQQKCKTSCGASDWWDISCPSITPVFLRILFQRRTQTLEYLRCLTVLVGVRLCSRIGVLNATIMYDTYKSYTNTGEML